MVWSAILFLMAAQAIDIPFGPRSELASPDGRHVLFLKRTPVPPELWVRHTDSSGSTRLLVVNRTARLQWAPDSSSFYVVDQDSSSSSETRVHDAQGRLTLVAGQALLKADPSLAQFTGHLYIEARDWIDSRTLRVYWFGHTDGPVTCFTFEYLLALNGEARRLSGRLDHPTATTVCRESPDER